MTDNRLLQTNGYRFKSKLGEGMYGKVVSASSAQLKKMVAIKIIYKKKLMSNDLEKFLTRELEIIQNLNHPNIVKTLDIIELRTSKVYVVMELCVKGDLLKHINSKGALSERSSRRLFTQLCEAVQYLHNEDVAHRDLKCENLLLDTNYNLKVCDFGFSKRIIYKDKRMVLSETYCGTSSYAAPEILRGFPYNPKVSDVWSMGVVLYMMLYASMPYDATNIKKMVAAQVQHDINFPNVPSVSSEAKDLIRRILHPVLEQRITISNIFLSSWMLLEGKVKDTDEAPTSDAGSGQERTPGVQPKEDKLFSTNSSDPGEGTSAAGQRKQ